MLKTTDDNDNAMGDIVLVLFLRMFETRSNNN